MVCATWLLVCLRVMAWRSSGSMLPGEALAAGLCRVSNLSNYRLSHSWGNSTCAVFVDSKLLTQVALTGD